jgi:hypothetical protein
MKMFEMLDQLHKNNPISENFYVPVNIPKSVEQKYTEIKEYKRQYYLINIEIYRERNKAYRQRMKDLKKGLKE